MLRKACSNMVGRAAGSVARAARKWKREGGGGSATEDNEGKGERMGRVSACGWTRLPPSGSWTRTATEPLLARDAGRRSSRPRRRWGNAVHLGRSTARSPVGRAGRRQRELDFLREKDGRTVEIEETRLVRPSPQVPPRREPVASNTSHHTPARSSSKPGCGDQTAAQHGLSGATQHGAVGTAPEQRTSRRDGRWFSNALTISSSAGLGGRPLAPLNARPAIKPRQRALRQLVRSFSIEYP